MNTWISAGCISVTFGALLLGGCAAGVGSESDDATIAAAPGSEPQDGFGSADLIPVHSADCAVVGVKNQGNISAPASTLRVKYSWRISPGVYDTWTEYFSVPVLAPNAEADFSYYPEECIDFDGDCDFVMKADSSSVVSESNESNNSVTTSCVFTP